MASNDTNEEKPNLRPTKRISAGGKSIFLHHNPNHPSNKSYIHAIWNDANVKPNENVTKRQDPFGISQPDIEYSLNKKHRWDILNDFRENIANQWSSSSDDELDVQSDSEQRKRVCRNKKKLHRRHKNSVDTKYRLYELHNIDQQANCISITSNTGPKRTQTPTQTYMQDQSNTSKLRNREGRNSNNENDNNRQQNNVDVTYYAVVPPPRDKHLTNVRKQHVVKGTYMKK